MMQGINSWQGTIHSCQEVAEKAEDGSRRAARKPQLLVGWKRRQRMAV